MHSLCKAREASELVDVLEFGLLLFFHLFVRANARFFALDS